MKKIFQRILKFQRVLSLTLLNIVMLIPSFNLNAESKIEQAKPDVRLLIDISGSMKQNDPNNLRVPALQLVTNLMPQGAEAGVWAFGRYVNMLVPLKPVDSNWQNKATQAALKINSAGLFTNIRGVLEKASFGWNQASSTEKRSLILLTDGMVDISKDPQVNEQERQKILSQVLPRLKQAKVTIHTIALSQNADHELLKELASATDGWYQAVNSPEELQKVFLKIFEQSAARDSLPLTNNQFKVDASIDEMTLLVFKKEASNKTALVTPEANIIETETSDGQVRWFSTDGYDLITIKKPQPGDWKIDADVDPDNRVMVVSKLGLYVDEVPNNLLAGEAINYQVSLLEDGELITKADFLKLVDARLLQEKSGQESRLAMFFDSANSQYKQNFFTDGDEGVLNLTLEVKSPTFERKRNHAVNIYGSPLKHEIELSADLEKKHQVLLSVREDIVQIDSLKVTAEITAPDEKKEYLTLDNFPRSIELDVIPEGGKYTIRLEIKGKSILSRDFSVTPPAIIVETLALNQTLTKTAVKEESKETEKPVVEEQKPEVKKDSQSESQKLIQLEPVKEEETNWSLWLWIGLGINLILIVAGFFIWKFLKKRNQNDTAALADQLITNEE